jgi:dipeptidyl aminopeptidase/acylaminoacyl peptidase
VQPADGSSKAERLITSEYRQIPNSWSHDGQFLAFHQNDPATASDIWVLRLSDRQAQPFLRTPTGESAARFSPDGRWLAYTSSESGRSEIYVQPYPGPGGKWQISTDGGTEPVWNSNGRELFFRQRNQMMAVDISTQPAFSAGKPQMLFDGPYMLSAATLPNYDVSRDGQRFLMVKESQQDQPPTQINVVLNWFEELKRLAPTGPRSGRSPYIPTILAIISGVWIDSLIAPAQPDLPRVQGTRPVARGCAKRLGEDLARRIPQGVAPYA